MRLLTITFLLASAALSAQTAEEAEIIAVVNKTFQGMAAHDAAMIRSTMLPEARLQSVRENGAPSAMAAEDFITRISATKGELIERFTAQPKVLVRGRIAQLWGEYEFLRDGKFSHCGIDTATLFKTAEGWKIASLVYTTETTTCGK